MGLNKFFLESALFSSVTDNDDHDDAHITKFIDTEDVTLLLFSACTTVTLHSTLCVRFIEENGKWLWVWVWLWEGEWSGKIKVRSRKLSFAFTTFNLCSSVLTTLLQMR